MSAKTGQMRLKTLICAEDAQLAEKIRVNFVKAEEVNEKALLQAAERDSTQPYKQKEHLEIKA